MMGALIQRRSFVTYRIHRLQRESQVVLALSGDLDESYVSELRAFLAIEGSHHIVLDLSDVTLVDREAVAFLAHVEGEGVVLENCPEYIRSWIAAEQHGT
jgi:ABC-type transporter Mla MlaB component